MKAGNLVGKAVIRTMPNQENGEVKFMERPIIIILVSKNKIFYRYPPQEDILDGFTGVLDESWNDNFWMEVPVLKDNKKPTYCPHCQKEININIGITK